jgi:hypothetical protein
MHMKRSAAIAAVVVAVAAGAASATHVPIVDPATVPTGFLAAHNSIEDVPISAIARAAASGGADVFLQHVRLPAGAATGWHTHPGPALVTVVSGSLTYEDAAQNRCRSILYTTGEGFADRGFGHVHRAVAGPTGVDFYVAYVLPPGSPTHVVPESAPPECT